MNGVELAALITAISGAVCGIGALVVNVRSRRAVEADKREREEHDRRLRSELVILGEGMAGLRLDNAKLALLVNQLFNQYAAATGKKPEIDFDLLKTLQSVSYITGPLGPLDLSVYKK